MEFKEKRSTSASPLFTLTNDNGLTMGFPDTTITLNGIDYDGSKVVLVTISYDQALLIGGRRTWCDLLINFGDDRVKNVFPSGIQVIGCKAVTTLPDEPDPEPEPLDGIKWIKVSMTGSGDDFYGYRAQIAQIAVLLDPLEVNPWMVGSFPLSLSLPYLGIASASSSNESYPPGGPFQAMKFCEPWLSESSMTRDPEYLAFNFNTPATIGYVYLKISARRDGSTTFPLGGGDILVSKDSIDGVDGTWTTLRSGIFDNLDTVPAPWDDVWDLQFFGALPSRDVWLEIPLSPSDADVTVYEDRVSPS